MTEEYSFTITHNLDEVNAKLEKTLHLLQQIKNIGTKDGEAVPALTVIFKQPE